MNAEQEAGAETVSVVPRFDLEDPGREGRRLPGLQDTDHPWQLRREGKRQQGFLDLPYSCIKTA